MSSLEKILIENMLRFGSKNLTEWDQRRLKQLLIEQDPEQTTATPAADSRTYVRGGSGQIQQILQKPTDWGISGFNPPEISTSQTMKPIEGESQITNIAMQWIDAYNAYLDAKTGYVGKTLLVFKDQYIDYRNIVKRIVVTSCYTDTKMVHFYERPATRNFDLANKTMVLKPGTPTLLDSTEYDISAPESGFGTESGFGNLQKADLCLLRGTYFTSVKMPKTADTVTLLKTRGGKSDRYVAYFDGKVISAANSGLIGYTPARAWESIPFNISGYGFELASGLVVPLQDDAYIDARAKSGKGKK
jgi:hypothetical protein